MEIIINTSTDMKDLIHAANNAEMFKDFLGEKVKMVAIIEYTKDEKNDKTGEMETKTISCIKTDKGQFIATISPTVKDSLDVLYNAFTPEEIAKGVDVVIQSKKSKNGRDFIFVDIA
jgi:hypothetical protein